MKIQTILLVGAILISKFAAAAPAYDCTSPRPEMAGFHNMVLFGAPDDELYVYHLPLFAGTTNGAAGHVLMHVYQGLWNVQLDAATKSAYDLKFSNERTPANPFPFFSIGPKGNRFKVPEMICNPNFSLSALAVFGHVESNPDFPQPAKLIKDLSAVTVKGQAVFARRFDGAARSALTYFIFGTPKQHYMVHFLTDDENSFDQIVAIEIVDSDLKTVVENAGAAFVTVPVISENELAPITENANQISPNNKWKLPVSSLGKVIRERHKITSDWQDQSHW
ncbi:MAG: hypothetical protein IPK68_03965 [Bdellovibrionales bacterium]|nr:hypothetical protein [Bdellovibrionales bacterium]